MAQKNRKHTNENPGEDTNEDRAEANARKKTTRSAGELRQRDLASDIQGRNKLQGNDQDAVRNQRRVQPKVGGATGRPGGKERGE